MFLGQENFISRKITPGSNTIASESGGTYSFKLSASVNFLKRISSKILSISNINYNYLSQNHINEI